MASEFVARAVVDTDRSSALRFIWSHIRSQRLFLALLIFGAAANSALGSVVPVLVGSGFDAIIHHKDLTYVAWMALLIIISQLVRGVVQFSRNFAAETFAQRIERDVRDELYVSLLGKSMAFHDAQPTGEIMARVTNDVREINLMMNPGVNLIIGSGMFLLIPLVTAPLIYPPLVLTPAVFIVAYVVVQASYVRSLHSVAQQVRASFGHMNAKLAEALDGIEVVKGTAQEDGEIARFNDLVDRVRKWFVLQGDIEARYYALLVLGLGFVGGFMHVAYLYRQGAIGPGDVVAFIGQLYLFTFPVFTSIFTFSRVASGVASAERILKILTARTDLDQNEAGHRAPIEGQIEFDGVDFGYTGAQQVLHDVSFQIKPGQTVAIVGQTGSGKTTLTRLINRTHDVDAGAVRVDGVEAQQWNLAALRSQISIIEQEVFLFSRTIAENICFGRPDAPRADIEAAAQKAQAHDFIMAFPDGYDTVIGQRGVTLSGGQRQRLAIARAFLTDPRILILDDSTSAIDSATEDRIQKAIWTASKGRTTILITHRLSQIRWADWILVIRQGRIAAQGTHDDLLRHSEPYRRIFARFDDDDKSESEVEVAAGDNARHQVRKE